MTTRRRTSLYFLRICGEKRTQTSTNDSAAISPTSGFTEKTDPPGPAAVAVALVISPSAASVWKLCRARQPTSMWKVQGRLEVLRISTVW